MQPKFRWKCSYMGTVEYEISDRTGVYRAEIRHSVGDYELSIANGETVRRDMKAAIGILHRCHFTDSEFRASCDSGTGGPFYVVPAETVAAFNAWRAAEHAEHIAKLEAEPHSYGVIAADDPIRKPPMVAVGGHYMIGTGWIKHDAQPEAVAA